jgi:hypothetical protein
MDKSIEHLYPSTENTSSKSPWVYNYNFGVPQFYNRSCCCVCTGFVFWWTYISRVHWITLFVGKDLAPNLQTIVLINRILKSSKLCYFKNVGNIFCLHFLCRRVKRIPSKVWNPSSRRKQMMLVNKWVFLPPNILCLYKIPKHYVSDGILKRNCLAMEH